MQRLALPWVMLLVHQLALLMDAMMANAKMGAPVAMVAVEVSVLKRRTVPAWAHAAKKNRAPSKASGNTGEPPGDPRETRGRPPGGARELPKQPRERFGGHRESPGKPRGSRGRATGNLARAPAARNQR